MTRPVGFGCPAGLSSATETATKIRSRPLVVGSARVAAAAGEEMALTEVAAEAEIEMARGPGSAGAETGAMTAAATVGAVVEETATAAAIAAAETGTVMAATAAAIAAAVVDEAGEGVKAEGIATRL